LQGLSLYMKCAKITLHLSFLHISHFLTTKEKKIG
jgi:hypothetical protein